MPVISLKSVFSSQPCSSGDSLHLVVVVVMLEPLVKAQTKSVRSEILASFFLVESMDPCRSSFISLLC